MRRWLLTSTFLLAPSLALAQGCGPTNPNCIVPTRPMGDSTNAAASTAFVQASVGGGGSGFSGIVNVKNPPFNALCDGVTDDTTAIQTAMNNAAGLFIPAGTCIVSNLVATQNTRISGNGQTSVLKFKTGSTGYMLESTASFYIKLSSLDLDGGNTADYELVTSPGTRSGVHLWANIDNSSIIDTTIHGFNNIAVGLNGDQNANENGTVIVASAISKNYCAIDTGPSGANHDVCNATAGTTAVSGAEYLKILGNTLVNDRFAFVVDSGNVNITSNTVAHNGYCLWVNGAPSPNPAHGNFVGNLCNHSFVNAVTLQSGIATGFNINDNQFFGGAWVLSSTDGIRIALNTIATTSISVNGAGYNLFANNWFTQNIPVITGSPTNTSWDTNYSQTAQDYFQNSARLLIDPKGTTAKSVSQTLGANVVTDGTFTVDPGPWTKGPGWTINTGTNSAHGDGTSSTSFLDQAIGAGPNQFWQVTFTIANYVSGNVVIGVGGAVANFPAFANGTYTFVVPTASNAPDGNLYFVGNLFLGDIRNVSALKWATYGTINTTYQQSTPITVAELEACNAANEGARAYVTDQNTAVAYRGAVTGAGATRQAVLCSNTAWIQD